MAKERLPLERLVVVGNGMAGCRAVQEVLKRDPERYEIAVFGSEPRVNYNRIMLSPVLAGEKTFDDIVINDAAWYADSLEARRDVDAIAEKIVVVDDDVADVNADAKFDPELRRHGGVDEAHRLLPQSIG